MGEVGIDPWGGGGGSYPRTPSFDETLSSTPYKLFPGTSVKDARGNFPIHYAADVKDYNFHSLVCSLGGRR